MASYYKTCTIENDNTCLHCCRGSKYEGPDASITHSVSLYPTVTVNRHVTFNTSPPTKGSEDQDYSSSK